MAQETLNKSSRMGLEIPNKSSRMAETAPVRGGIQSLLLGTAASQAHCLCSVAGGLYLSCI